MTNEELFLRKDFDTLYTRNEAFTHYICKRYLNLGIEYEELLGCANIAFVICTKTFNPTNSRWLTYFSKVLTNEILMLNRKQRKWKTVVSLQDTLALDHEGHELTLEDVIEADTVVADEIIDHLAAKELYVLIQGLNQKQQEVMELFLKGKKQKEIGRLLGISQSYVSRLIASITMELKELYKQGA